MSSRLLQCSRAIREGIDRAVVGREDLKRLLIVGLLAGGHVLMEGLPGTGKTTTARTFAAAIGGDFRRIQMAPDTLPSDITGFYLYEMHKEPRFIPGPVFGNVILVDELNRTTPRTQSALLEAMQEGQVTLDGVTHLLPQPRMVIATELPYGGPGTYPLTTVQSDRFMLRGWSGLPSLDEEREIVTRIDDLEATTVEPVASPEEITSLRSAVAETLIADTLIGYILSLIEHVRNNHYVLEPMSPRATISLYKCARALAFLSERDYVLPDDIKSMFPAIAHHRVVLSSEAEATEIGPADIIDAALTDVAVPRTF